MGSRTREDTGKPGRGSLRDSSKMVQEGGRE